MATLAGLAERMRKMEKEVAQYASDVAVDAALTIVADVAVHTPADTSKAASNWQVALGGPVEDEIEAYAKGKFGSTAQLSVDTAYTVARLLLKNKIPGESIFISNVTKYIQYLNDGSSDQQPAGFVERAVMVGKDRVKNTPVKMKEK